MIDKIKYIFISVALYLNNELSKIPLQYFLTLIAEEILDTLYNNYIKYVKDSFNEPDIKLIMTGLILTGSVFHKLFTNMLNLINKYYRIFILCLPYKKSI